MHVSQLFVHPIKSAASLSVSELQIEDRGPRFDRRWMLVDDAGRFVSGRELGDLVRLGAEPQANGLRLRWSGEQLDVPLPGTEAARCQVGVWNDQVDAVLADQAAGEWLSRRLNRSLRLVYMDELAERSTSGRYPGGASAVSFADGFPLLLISAAAVEAVNDRAGGGIDARRFRPNIVVAGCVAHAEDGWGRLRIGEVELQNAKPCVRCVFTTVIADDGQLDSGQRDRRGEPLRSLKDYRRGDKGITFGVNLVALKLGRIALGDPVELLD